jgi:type IV pilus assembly protein PilW
MHTVKTDIKKQTGFSLVEVMVGMVVALISTIIVLQVFSSFEGQKRTTSSGSDAQTNGGIGLYTIERDMRMAGYGLSDAIGCTVNTALNTSIHRTVAGSSFVMSPVSIVDGAIGEPDIIKLLGSNKTGWSVPARNITAHAQADTTFNTNATVGMENGDFIVAYEAGLTCALLQITSADPVINPVAHTAVAVAPSALVWNNTATFPAAGYSDEAFLINLGSILYHVYSLDANNNLTFSEYDSSTNSLVSRDISSDVVNLQAQYGFDTRVGAQTTSIIDTWSSDMIDADASGGAAGDAADVQRIYAIRFVIVARSGLREKATAGGVCDITTTNPTWAGSALPGGSIDLSLNPDGSANPDWQCYRYKTFETVVPLRNLLWR